VRGSIQGSSFISERVTLSDYGYVCKGHKKLPSHFCLTLFIFSDSSFLGNFCGAQPSVTVAERLFDGADLLP
jgi:hypothetical protein